MINAPEGWARWNDEYVMPLLREANDYCLALRKAFGIIVPFKKSGV